MFFLSAFMMGLLGSMHCLGMCGPIVLVIHGKTPFLGRLTYHVGRIAIYASIGLIAGAMGGAIHLAASQEAISIVAGILMLLMLIAPSATLNRLPILRSIGKVYGRLQEYARPLWKEQSFRNNFALGMLNGILPCGFLYAALVGALSAGSPLGGTLWMTLFGIGTAPSLILAGSAVSLLNKHAQQSIRKVLPYGTAIIALLFIVRGMSLGIPFISPILPSTTPAAITQKQSQPVQEHQCCVPEKKHK